MSSNDSGSCVSSASTATDRERAPSVQNGLTTRLSGRSNAVVPHVGNNGSGADPVGSGGHPFGGEHRV